MIVLRPLEAPLSIISIIQLSSCYILVNCLQQQVSLRHFNSTPTSKYELKFQNELDNSTTLKQEQQQQIFKCQVKLAPVSTSAQPVSSVSRARFKSSYSLLQANTTTPSQQQQQQPTRPSNLILTIDWLKDDQLIGGASPLIATHGEGEPIAVINVELKSNNSNGARNDKKSSGGSGTKRIEIKNTLNGNQMKLTSRLRLLQLKTSDSGQYKCIARASFQIQVHGADGIEIGQSPSQTTGEISSSALGPSPASGQSVMFVQIEQTLESSGANLLVTNMTTDEQQEPSGTKLERVGGQDGAGGSASGSQRDPAGSLYGKPQKRERTKQNNNLGLWNLGSLFKSNTNDNQYATKIPQRGGGDHLPLGGGRQTTITTATTDSASSGSPMGPSNGSAAVVVRGPIAGNEQLGGRDDNNENAEGPPWPSSGRSNFNQQKQQHKLAPENRFEDDEDLFKMEQERLEFINGQRSTKTAAAANDDEDEPQRRAPKQQQQLDRQQSTSGVQVNDMSIIMGGDAWASSAAAANEDDLDSNNESSSSASSGINLQQQQQQQLNRHDRGPIIGPIKEDMSFMASSSGGGGGETTNYRGAGLRGNIKSGFREPSSVFTMDHYFSGSLDSTRMRLVKLVHRIAPELSCYTGNGEHYRGNVSVSADKRPCMRWSLIRSSISGDSSLEATNDHNHCRNPNGDSRGPWCYVQYMDTADYGTTNTNTGSAVSGGHYEASNPAFSIGGATWKDNNDSTRSYNNIILSGTRYVPSPCSISPCSEYLWLYIVAPPLGLLILLSFLGALLVRSIRKSHCRAIFSKMAKRRPMMPNVNRLLSMRSKIVGRKFCAGRKKCGANYLDEDIFEIVDDIDWSDGQTQSLSPKSTTTESLKLNSSFSSASTSNDAESRLLGFKPTKPVFFGNISAEDRASATDLFGAGGAACNKQAVAQVGPMFATLRCHIRESSLANQTSRPMFNNNKPRGSDDLNSSSSNGRFTSADWVAAASQMGASISSSDCSERAIQSQQHKQQTDGTSHLNSSCSPTTDSSVIDSGGEASFDHIGEKYIKGTDLPQINASSLSLVPEQQPLYEGKFSQVQLAYYNIEKQQELNEDTSSAKEAAFEATGDRSSPRHHQVAVCSLKAAPAIDLATLKPSNLKLRNLNHLNLLKLIGCAQLNTEIGLTNNAHHHQQQQQQQQQHQSTMPIRTHSLIYDMAQMVDLSDWLKQQNKDIMTTNEPGSDLRVRRNLTCFAKQIALAIDYLHDQGIIYRDLACRNCFLDPTKMLVKLASFNIELVIDHSSSNDKGGAGDATIMKAQNLRSMIRPKYLLDYYVIDSRPADCQLLPLSWIPLESILFNKFNKQTDVWSFGCLLYELFSLGKVAYFGYSSKQIIDAVRSNLMPPQPLLCPNGVYKLMCKCLSDIPSIRPNVKQVYEQLNLFSGQCSSFLDHHLCSLAITMYDDQFQHRIESIGSDHSQLIELKSSNSNSITKTKSYANIRSNFSPSANRSLELSLADYDNLMPVVRGDTTTTRPETGKIPMSKSINLAGVGGSRLVGGGFHLPLAGVGSSHGGANHYDEPVVVEKSFGPR